MTVFGQCLAQPESERHFAIRQVGSGRDRDGVVSGFVLQHYFDRTPMSFFNFAEDVERALRDAADEASRLSAKTAVHRANLPAAVERAGFRYLTAGGSFSPGNHDLAIGVAAWSDPDLATLEELASLTRSYNSVPPRVDACQWLDRKYFAVSLTVSCSPPAPCTATLSAYQAVSGTQTTLLQAVPVNGKLYQVGGITVSTGAPGVGGSGLNDGNLISNVQFGPLDTVPPSAVNPNTNKAFTTDVYATAVTAEWQAAVDNPGNGDGSGVVYYNILRGDGYSMMTYDASFYDPAVQPSTIYSYGITAYDFHGNAGPATTLSVSTPPAGSIDPHRVGVMRSGNYWGGGGEQIDLVSGNLNFTLPLVTAVGRNGQTATFALSHNSQNWRSFAGADRLLGADTGYGFGWQLMLGSLLPVWGGDFTLQYYLYTDSTGAQYQLNQNLGNGVYGSSNSVYVWYDSNANILHFPNGSFWVMGCTSAGAEQDAGTLYPTVVEDSNGNQIIVSYMAGAGVSWNNSNARISTIEDTRAAPAYQFSYSSTAGQDGTTIYYLSSIASNVGTPENYAVNIAPGQPLYSPDNSYQAFTTGGMLEGVTATGPVQERRLEARGKRPARGGPSDPSGSEHAPRLSGHA
jgi:hypothetical protein